MSVVDITPAVVSGREAVRVVLRIRNAGDSTVSIPASRDFAVVHHAGNQDQRNLVVTLILRNESSGKSAQVFIGKSASSATVPSSTVELGPGDTVTLRCQGPVDWGLANKDWGTSASFVGQAAVALDLFEESEYTIYKHSADVVSTNSFRLRWRL